MFFGDERAPARPTSLEGGELPVPHGRSQRARAADARVSTPGPREGQWPALPLEVGPSSQHPRGQTQHTGSAVRPLPPARMFFRASHPAARPRLPARPQMQHGLRNPRFRYGGCLRPPHGQSMRLRPARAESRRAMAKKSWQKPAISSSRWRQEKSMNRAPPCLAYRRS